eukprot:17438-Heterococcus_DN1.PRE.1
MHHTITGLQYIYHHTIACEGLLTTRVSFKNSTLAVHTIDRAHANIVKIKSATRLSTPSLRKQPELPYGPVGCMTAAAAMANLLLLMIAAAAAAVTAVALAVAPAVAHVSAFRSAAFGRAACCDVRCSIGARQWPAL